MIRLVFISPSPSEYIQLEHPYLKRISLPKLKLWTSSCQDLREMFKKTGESGQANRLG